MALRVYYIDDEPALLSLFSDLFSSRDVEITGFSDPVEALNAVKASPPDLIFIDLRLPHISGVDLASRMDPGIPKALVTGNLTIKAGGGFKAVFSKPLDQDAIESFIHSHLHQASAP